MKVCTKCKQKLPESEFYKDTRRPDGLRSICKKCWSLRGATYRKNNKQAISESGKRYYEKNKVRLNEKSAKWRASNPERVALYHKARTDRLKALIDDRKTNCVKCGESRKYLIQFHHIDNSTKLFEVNAGRVGGASYEEVNAEIEKCVCLCPNCHFEFHYIYGMCPENPTEAFNEYIRS